MKIKNETEEHEKVKLDLLICQVNMRMKTGAKTGGIKNWR